MNYFIITTILFYFISFQFPLINSLSTVSISSTNNQTLICAIINPSILNCTSYPSGIQFPITNSHNVSYTRVVGGNGFLCGIRSQSFQSVMDCWRFFDLGKKIVHKRIYKGPILSEIVAGNSHICGIVNPNTNTNTNTSSNILKCWQWREWNSNSQVPSFSRIAIGDDFLCGIVKNNGSIYCLGNNVIKSYPNGNFSVISASKNSACAVELNGSLQCWGDMVGNRPEGVFKDVALGDRRSCAIRDNGLVICWGSDRFKVPDALEGTYFIGVVAQGSVFCGVVTSNYSLVCWGNEVIDENRLVFSSVMPGVCVRECPLCGPLPLYGQFCGMGLMVCQPCAAVMGLNGSSLSPDSPPGLVGNKSSDIWNAKMIVYLVVGCVGAVCWVAIVVVLIWRYCRGKGCRVHDSGPMELVPNTQGSNTQESRHEHDEFGELPVAPPVLEKRFSHMYSIDRGGSLEEFSLKVLLEVTQNFSLERRIGIGSFGSVYHATLDDGREVAIKRAEVLSRTNALGTNRRQEDKDVAFMAELDVLSRLNHKHLVKLIGFFEDANERVLVYEFLNNFTLHDHLHKLKDSSPLASWPNRIRVALDAARGIDYLHAYAVPPIIHRDIKPSNILLDDTWTAKVSDFGLSLMGPQEGESHLSLMAAGTFGYVDPEYYKLHQLTTKSDVYSFGVVLLEILSGFKAIHINEDGTPRNVVDFMVPYIIRGDIHRVLDSNVPPPTPVEIEAVMLVGDLAVDCVSLEGRNRPSMSNVVSFLERALAACLVRPTFSSSSETSSR